MRRLLTAVALGAACIGVGATRAQDAPLPPENRWAILIDASDASANEKTAAARAEFCEGLSKSGIPTDHIFVYSTDATDEARRPTRANILAVLDALRNVDGTVQLDPEGAERRRWRGSDEEAPCEAQLYVIAGGVSVEVDGQTRNFVAPCDAPIAEITGADDERLINVVEIESALTKPEGFPIERVFLSINFWSTEKTRDAGSAGSASNLADVDLKSVGSRSARDEEESETAKGYSYVCVLTNNARFDDANVDSFYKTLTTGLEGYADFARNGDGQVGALELAEYVRDVARAGSVELFVNGSAPYSLAVAERKIEPVPAELFEEIEKIMTNPKNRALQESARNRKNRVRVQASKNDAGAAARSSEGTRGVSESGGVWR